MSLDAVRERQAWLDTHPTEDAWEADLRQRITSRTHELGETAAHDPDQHIVRLIGPVPNPDRAGDRARWATLAGRIEAYRERWAVDPDRVAVEPDGRGEQHRHWQRLMFAIDDARRGPEEPGTRPDPATGPVRRPSPRTINPISAS